MPVREALSKVIGYVLFHVERARASLVIVRNNLAADGVFIHAKSLLVALKVAREELDKAIALIEGATWTR